MGLFEKKEKVVIPTTLPSPLNNQMPNYATYTMSAFERIAVWAVSFVAGGVVGLIFYANLFMQDGVATTATRISNIAVFVLVGVLGMKVFTPLYQKSRLNKQGLTLKTQFRALLEALATSFSSGSNAFHSFQSAYDDLKNQFDENAFILLEMQEILAGVRQNIPIEDMIRSFGQRSGNEDIESFANIFEICARKGGDMKSVILRTHHVIGEKMDIQDEIATKLTSNKMQHNLMSVMPIGIVAMLRFTNPAFAASFATVSGVIVNTLAIGIFVGAYLFGQKIIAIKE